MALAKSSEYNVSQGLRWSVVVTLAMLIISWQDNSARALLLAIPFSLAAYLLYFSVGTPSLAAALWQWCDNRLSRLLLLPLALVALLYLYVWLMGANPWQGNSWQIPLLFCAPVLFYYWAVGRDTAITWRDAIGAVLCVLPYALHDYYFATRLPSGGGGIESLYLTLAIIVAVYAVVVVRQLARVGFEFTLSFTSAKLVLMGWALFFLLVLAIGIPGGLLKWSGYEPLTPALLISGLALFLRTLFGTALPEELFFRGFCLNLLEQRITQSGNWRRYLYGALLLLPLAALVGYAAEEKAQWFPLLVAALLVALTFHLNGRNVPQAAYHTALLIVSTLFGLVHFHIHSNLFIGLAMVAGWLYGHVYRKTGSVFYAALTHTLVNVSPPLFGFILVR